MTMTTIENDYGTFVEETNGTMTLRYERTYRRPIDTVWSAITQPERFSDWLGAGELEPCVGGRFAVRVGPGGQVSITGTVLEWEPPSVLACSWVRPGGEATVIRYDLSTDGEQATRLLFTHTNLPVGEMASVLPGWHLYLERLGQAVAGSKPDPDFSVRHSEVRALYGSRSGVEAAICQP